MIIKYKYGFYYENLLFGWFKKELYRLPQNINNRFFTLKKLNQIMIGNNVGYRIGGDKKTIEQLLNITIVINKEVSVIKDEDLPF